MELKLVNGDYQPDGRGGLEQAEEEILQRALSRLTARRGSYPSCRSSAAGSAFWGRWRPWPGRRRRSAM